MTLWTSYFGNLKNIPDNYLRVSISRFTPTYFTNAWNQVVCKDCILAPSNELVYEYRHGNLTDKDYTIMYLKELKSNIQNAGYQSLKDYLVAMINFYYKEGFHDNSDKPVKFDNIVFLCYESPNEFCHRHILAKAIEKNGFQCKELVKDEKNITKKTNNLF